jgi:predicted ester cyclase
MRTMIAAAGLAVMALAGAASSASAQDADQNKTLFTVVVNQVYNGGDLALVDDLVSTNVSHNGAPLGRDGYKTLVKDERAKDPSRKLTVNELVTDGDRVIGRLSSSTGGGEILVLRIQDGQVTEQWTMADEPALRKQFGLKGNPAGSGTSAN